jgi:hypothetical protein
MGKGNSHSLWTTRFARLPDWSDSCRRLWLRDSRGWRQPGSSIEHGDWPGVPEAVEIHCFTTSPGAASARALGSLPDAPALVAAKGRIAEESELDWAPVAERTGP